MYADRHSKDKQSFIDELHKPVHRYMKFGTAKDHVLFESLFSLGKL
jgi:hypothetical protein